MSIAGDAELANLPVVAFTYGAVDFTPDGRRLVTTGDADLVTVWDAQSFEPVETLDERFLPAPGETPGDFGTLGTGSEASNLDVSPDGRFVAVAGFDGRVRVWDMETRREAFTVDPGPAMVPFMSVARSPDGDLLAVVASDSRAGRATVVDRSGHVIGVLQQEAGTAIGVPAFTPDSRHLVTTLVPTGPRGRDEGAGGVVMWDWRNGDVVPILDAPASRALPSPTGHLVATTARAATGSSDTVEVWDPGTRGRVAALEGNTGGVSALAFSADGSRLATGSRDGTVRIWDPSSGEQLLVLPGHDASVFSVAFSPDGSRLASLAGEGVVRVWALDLDDIVEIAQRKVTRTLTDSECRQYLHQRRCA